MTSVYHLDGADLRMTHYCAAGNQPRLRAERIDAAAGEAEFAFVDATGIGPRNPGHVRKASVKIVTPASIVISFTFEGGAGPPAIETIRLTRVAAGS